MKILKCSKFGFDCDRVIRGKSNAEVLARTVAHINEEHDLKEIKDALLDQIRSSIEKIRLKGVFLILHCQESVFL